MREVEKIIIELCVDYSNKLQSIIEDARSRDEVLRKRDALRKEILQRYNREIEILPEGKRSMPSNFKVAQKYINAYSESLTKMIEEEDRPELLSGRKKLMKNLTASYSSEIKRIKRKKQKKVLTSAVAGAVVAGGILAGVLSRQDSRSGGGEIETKPPVIDTFPQGDGIIQGPTGGFFSGGVPEIRSYKNENGEFLRLDNIVDINEWAYNEVCAELKAYQKANPDAKYDFDMSLLSPEIGCGTHIAEASGMINCNKDNPNYQGPYSVGIDKEYIESLNIVSRALTGENCIDPNNISSEVQDPRIACKAFWYNVIENYRQLKYALSDAGLSDVEITQRLIIDAYLNGATGAVRKITNGKDYQRPYADKIMEYAEVFEDYAESLSEHPEIREMDSSTYGRNAHLRLGEVTEKYSDTYGRNGNSSGEQME